MVNYIFSHIDQIDREGICRNKVIKKMKEHLSGSRSTMEMVVTKEEFL